MNLYDHSAASELMPWEKEALECFSLKMKDQKKLFPCIPAVMGHNAGHLRFGFIGSPSSSTSCVELAELLGQYGKKFHECGQYTSLIVFAKAWENTEDGTIEDAENEFWELLTRVRHQDQSPWPARIPEDPEQPDWEYCFGGIPYFVYCATPLHHNRKSRHFPYLMLAFTPRQILRHFNERPVQAAKIKKQIRKRLKDYDTVPAHPSLNTYGNKDNFEWKQYFLHDGQTERPSCPFHSLKKETE